MRGLIIETARLIIRPYERSDAPAMARAFNHAEVAAGVLTLPHPYGEKEANEFLDRIAPDVAAEKSLVCAVLLRETGEMVGSAGFRIERDHDRAELGYMFGRDHWGKGYATEASRAMIAYGFERLNLHTIFGGTWDWNHASGEVLKKVGMQFEGRLRGYLRKGTEHLDSLRYSILRSEYDAQRAAGAAAAYVRIIEPEVGTGETPVDHTTDQIAELLPEISQIQDRSLRGKVAAVWSEALTTGAGGKGWTFDELRSIPFTLLAGDIDLRYVEHLRSCAQQCMAIADVLGQIFGKRIPVNRDHLLAGALLADVGKPLEFDRDAGGKLIKGRFGDMLRHPFSGVAMCYKHGIPPEVMHIVATHSHEGDKVERSIESIIFHHADFIDFDIAKFLGKQKK